MANHFRRMFLSGLFALIPVAITVWVISSVFLTVDSVLQPILDHLLKQTPLNGTVRGLGFAATIVLVYLLGLVANNVLGKRILRAWETFISRIPVVKGLYGGVKQVAEAFGPQSRDEFREVVMLEFPAPGNYALGFATAAINAPGVGPARYVFVPTTPNPTSGYLLIVPREKLRALDMTVEDGLKIVVSGGVVGPSLKVASDKVVA